MTVYKIRHKPTGLFYLPRKEYNWNKPNFSNKGKIYTSKPKLCYGLMVTNKEARIKIKYPRIEEKSGIWTPERDWEIVEFDLVERMNNNE